jgi:hypothetical protein
MNAAGAPLGRSLWVAANPGFDTGLAPGAFTPR